MPDFSDYLVFVDESGVHGLVSVDSNYPMFVLACCLVAKPDYVEQISPALQRLKFSYWGHDEQVLQIRPAESAPRHAFRGDAPSEAGEPVQRS